MDVCYVPFQICSQVHMDLKGHRKSKKIENLKRKGGRRKKHNVPVSYIAYVADK